MRTAAASRSPTYPTMPHIYEIRSVTVGCCLFAVHRAAQRAIDWAVQRNVHGTRAAGPVRSGVGHSRNRFLDDHTDQHVAAEDRIGKGGRLEGAALITGLVLGAQRQP